MKRLWRDYSLGWVLFALFLASWAIQSWTGWQEFKSEQRTHQESAEVFGSDGYVWTWAESTFENWQSEFLQLFAFVTLTTFLIFRNSPESRDGDDEMREMLARLERRLEDLQATNVVEPSSSGNEPGLKSQQVSTIT
jgi:hypothetical protein